MKAPANIRKHAGSKVAAIFKKMLEDKNAVRQHLESGGKIADLKNKFCIVKTDSIKGP
jgi:hypothetical protein